MAVLSDHQREDVRQPLAGPPTAATAVALSNPCYQNKADEGRSSLAFATARREVLSGFPYASSRTLHRADPSPFEQVIRTLLHFASPFPTPPSPPPTGPCGPPSDASPGDFQRSPLRRTLLKSPLPWRHRCRHFGSNGATVRPCSVFAVSHRPDDFLLSNPARVLQRAADHEVRGVLNGPRETAAPPRYSCPSKSSPRPQLLTAPLEATRGPTSGPGFHRGFHRRPCLPTLLCAAAAPSLKRHPGWLDLEAFLQDRARGVTFRFQRAPLDTPLGLPAPTAASITRSRRTNRKDVTATRR